MKTHPGLSDTWYRTPLYFISRRTFQPDVLWSYGNQFGHNIHFPIFNRKMNVDPGAPWDRFPSDTLQPWDGSHLIFVPVMALVEIPYALSYLAAWGFHFPTATEMWLWRVCAIYQSLFLIILVSYMAFQEAVQRLWPKKSRPSHTKSRDISPSTGLRNWKFVSDLEAWLQRCRNLSPDQDPDMAVQVRWIFPAIFAIFIFILCRLVFYSLDFAGLREQPLGVYKTVNRFVLFL